MRQPVDFTPWALDVPTLVWILVGGVLLIVAIYLAARAGREWPERKEASGQPAVRTYAGILRSHAHPLPVFIILFSALALLWAAWYILRIAALGLYY